MLLHYLVKYTVNSENSNSKSWPSICLQIFANCSCISEWYAITNVEVRHPNFTLCANCTLDDEQFSSCSADLKEIFSKVLCSLRVANDLDVRCDCELPCDEMIYDVSVSASGMWPHKSYQTIFYEAYVKENYGEKIDKYAKNAVSLLLLVVESQLCLFTLLAFFFPLGFE